MTTKSWEERIADYIWKEFWIAVVGAIIAAGIAWYVDYPIMKAIWYFLLGVAISIWMNWKRDFPKRNE